MLHRVQAGFETAAIDAGLAALPPQLRERLLARTRFHFGVDPAFAGLAAYDPESGHGYAGGPLWHKSAAHVLYPWRLADPTPDDSYATIVVPATLRLWGPRAPAVVVHELAHVLDWLTGFSIDFVLPALRLAPRPRPHPRLSRPGRVRAA
jgi:hypothetical protein